MASSVPPPASSVPPPPPPDDRIRYRRSDGFAFCRQCLTHVALMRPREGESQNIAMFHNQRFLFKDAVNLRLDEEHEIRDGGTIVRAYCNHCGAYLGVRLVSLTVQDEIFREGRYYLNGLKMLVWYNNKMWYGHTPAEVEQRIWAAMAEHVLFGY